MSPGISTPSSGSLLQRAGICVGDLLPAHPRTFPFHPFPSLLGQSFIPVMRIPNSRLCCPRSSGSSIIIFLLPTFFWESRKTTPLITTLLREPGTEQPLPGPRGHQQSWNVPCRAAGLCRGHGELPGLWGGHPCGHSSWGAHGSRLLQVLRPRLAPERRWPRVAPPRRRRPGPRPGPSCPLANPPSAMWYVGDTGGTAGVCRGWRVAFPVWNEITERSE